MNKYLVKMDDLKEQGEEMQKYATDIIDGKIKELLKIVNELEWRGTARDQFYESFSQIMKKIRYVSDIHPVKTVSGIRSQIKIRFIWII